MPLDPELATLLKDAGLGQDAVWQHKQSKQWIVYHWALEEVAARRDIVLDPPHVVTADPTNKIAVICVTGRMGDQVEWSFGEAAPYNTTQTYPFAMAEKRAKDRVILKLLKLHGRFYSEEEADTFKTQANVENAPAAPAPNASNQTFGGPLTKTELKGQMRAFAGDLAAVEDYDSLVALLNTSKAMLDQCMRDLPSWWYGDDSQSGAQARIEARQKELSELADKEKAA